MLLICICIHRNKIARGREGQFVDLSLNHVGLMISRDNAFHLVFQMTSGASMVLVRIGVNVRTFFQPPPRTDHSCFRRSKKPFSLIPRKFLCLSSLSASHQAYGLHIPGRIGFLLYHSVFRRMARLPTGYPRLYTAYHND